MATSSLKKRADGWWYPWIFVAAFAVVFAVNGVMIYFALNTWGGLETPDYIQEGEHFNDQLQQKAAQEKLGWTPTLTNKTAALADIPHAQFLRLRFTNATAQGVNNLIITATAMRPTQEKYDQSLTFKSQGDGVYVALAKLKVPGIWDIRITARRANNVFKLIKRIQIP